MTLKGRRKIVTQFTKNNMDDPFIVARMINNTISTHRANKIEIDYLVNYYKGIQPILTKQKTIREDINNIMVVNHAARITRTITGYFLGNPIQYIQATANGKDEIDRLNRILSYEDKSSVDREIGEKQSICGTAYRIIFSDSDPADEIPFEDKSLDPSYTYVIYENTIAERPVAGITYHQLLNEFGEPDGYKYYAYTDIGVYEFLSNSDGTIENLAGSTFSPYKVGGVPIIEYPNNSWRIGDWELQLHVMDAINALQSGRLDDVEQIIESLLVFVNADIDSDTYDEMRDKGIVLLKNTSNLQSMVQVIKNPLDQTGMNLFAKELENLLDTLVGIPSRDTRGGGGGDTGQAVELRDGWADLEIVARNKELVFKSSEKKTLKIILNIMNSQEGMKLSLLDIDIKFTRNKNHNLLVKTQSYQTLFETKTLTPSDCLTIVDLVSDVNEYANRGEEYWITKNEEAMKNAKLLQGDSDETPKTDNVVA